MEQCTEETGTAAGISFEHDEWILFLNINIRVFLCFYVRKKNFTVDCFCAAVLSFFCSLLHKKTQLFWTEKGAKPRLSALSCSIVLLQKGLYKFNSIMAMNSCIEHFFYRPQRQTTQHTFIIRQNEQNVTFVLAPSLFKKRPQTHI